MKIGLLAPPWLPVPPPAYGGTEVVIDALARGLVEAGHEVRVFTVGDSDVPVPIGYVHEHAVNEQMGDGAVELGHLAEGYEALSDCDIIHDHTLAGPLWALAHGYQQVVTTCHGPLTDDFYRVYRAYAKQLPVIAISRDQAARAPDVTIAKVIHHGIDPRRFRVGDGQGGYLLFLGRMTPAKGAHEACLIAREAGYPLKVAAKMRSPDEKAYFRDRVEPLLCGDVEYVGEAANHTKLELLGEARALLNPIRWPEPFGLVMIEALACGTPVVALNAGATSEIVEDGLTGFVCTDRGRLLAAIDRVDELSRQDCRAAVTGYFSSERMVSEHVDLYEGALR
jgi:glycosyltransferase involved in cell wall biosynthesis